MNDKNVYICITIILEMFLVIDENMRLCRYMAEYCMSTYLWTYSQKTEYLHVLLTLFQRPRQIWAIYPHQTVVIKMITNFDSQFTTTQNNFY